jgi:hypothetical protein
MSLSFRETRRRIAATLLLASRYPYVAARLLAPRVVTAPVHRFGPGFPPGVSRGRTFITSVPFRTDSNGYRAHYSMVSPPSKRWLAPEEGRARKGVNVVLDSESPSRSGDPVPDDGSLPDSSKQGSADDFREQAKHAKITAGESKSLKESRRHRKRAKALNDMADNADWLDGKQGPKARR